MTLLPGKLVSSPSQTKSAIVYGVFGACFILFVLAVTGPLNSMRVVRSAVPAADVSPISRCPVIIYNKQIKTGSTVLANVLYRTTESYGCYNAGCRLHQLLMNGNASHIGARNGLTLTCHAQEKNKNIIVTLRGTHGKEFAYIASVREPVGWFKSAACFFYKQNVNDSVDWSDEGFKTAIDWLLQPAEFHPLEAYLFLSLGLQPNNSKREILDKLVMYDLIIDHAKMNEGLKELGTLLGWKLLKPSKGKDLTYRGSLYKTYRASEIAQVTSNIARLYEAAKEIREARHQRPAFAPKEAKQIR